MDKLKINVDNCHSMQMLILVATLCALTLAAPNLQPREAEDCSAEKCLPPDCRCALTSPPEGVELDQIPQFVFFTFDDDVEEGNYETYTEIFYNRTNPDGCPVSATFFVAHEYTDYTMVHDLYIHNQEIALHSITHKALTDYWKNISLEDLNLEFGGEKQLISKFANMPEDAIKGMRLPFLQLAGDNSYQVGKDIGLLYDCSWPTQTFRNPGLWPYTLDYRSYQDCSIGPCPTDSIPGMWVVPMIEFTDQQNNVCSMVDACVFIPEDDPDALSQWFIDNFNVQYKGDKAPFGFYVHAAYFIVNPLRLVAYKKFVDYLQGLPDVYLVSPTFAINWIKHPVPIGSTDWPTCVEVEDTGCTPYTCGLTKVDNPYPEYMTFCGTECPNVYPWIGDPFGEGN